MGRSKKQVKVSVACVKALAQIPTTTFCPQNGPTLERVLHTGVSVALQMGSRRVQVIGRDGADLVGYGGVVRLKQAPIDRLHARGRLDDDPERNRALFCAGEKLRDHHYLAGLSGFPANDLLGSSGGGHPSSRTPITETMVRNRRALRLAESSMDAGDWRIVQAVVCEEADLEAAGGPLGYGNRHATNAVALDRLRRGLGALADLWGYAPPRQPGPTVPAADNDAGVTRAAV